MDRKGVGKIHPADFKNYLATLNLKKPHEIFDELSPIPALKEFTPSYIEKALKSREKTLKERYKDNKSYVKGMD
jgi:formamidopyrimidine-DNA glycosylase